MLRVSTCLLKKLDDDDDDDDAANMCYFSELKQGQYKIIHGLLINNRLNKQRKELLTAVLFIRPIFTVIFTVTDPTS